MASRDKRWPEVADAIEAHNLTAEFRIEPIEAGGRLCLRNSKGWLVAKSAKDALTEVQTAARKASK